MSLCDRCVDPGHCCRSIHLSHGPLFGASKLEALAWVASAQPAQGELGLPFIPERVKAPSFEGQRRCLEWEYSCPNLDETTGRCKDYNNRPKLCRSFRPGYEKPCAMYGKQSAPCDFLLKEFPHIDYNRMTVYAGPHHPELGEFYIERDNQVAGEVVCIECQTDLWTQPGKTKTRQEDCRSCKGSGYMMVSI